MFSIIIPTYNRSDNLKQTLESYINQSVPQMITEIIVVDDGSDEKNRLHNTEIVRNVRDESKFNIIYKYQDNSGPSKARNNGIVDTSGEYILITGDDIVPHVNMVEEHYLYHKNCNFSRNICVLGRVNWPTNKRISHFMDYINEMGLQFGYSIINDEKDVPFTFFYTSNISLNRNFLLEGKLFDTDFPYAAWEDIELSYRLKKRGLKIIYNKNAIGYHHHNITFNSFRIRQEKSGYSANIFCQKHPELKDFLGIKNYNKCFNPLLIYIKLIELFCLFADKNSLLINPKYYNIVLNHYYENGIRRYRKEHKTKQ
jgi:glycosyltransferase involved in cell wall biosynthesis